MKKNHRMSPVLGFCLCWLLTVGGCAIPMARYDRTVQLSAPLQPGSLFAAQTHNGSITVAGADVTDCALTATIIARAATGEQAQELAEQTKVMLEPSANTLKAKIEKPHLVSNQSICVNLNVTVPSRTNLELITHNGAVEVVTVEGNVGATTHNGGVTAKQVSGRTELRTHNGAIRCTEATGDAQLKTHNGSVKVRYSETAPPVCDTSIVTYNGGIDFTGPLNLSATVEASTHNGSIKTDLPITLTGEVSKKKLSGTIGGGQGKLHLETYNGSIAIR